MRLQKTGTKQLGSLYLQDPACQSPWPPGHRRQRCQLLVSKRETQRVSLGAQPVLEQ